jgi:nicotinamidase-related amidase
MNNQESLFIERGFGQKIGFGIKPAVLVIDMLNAFTNENLPLGTNQEPQIEVINKVLADARKNKIPIFFITIYYDDKDLADAGIWFKKMKGLETLRANTFEVEIDSRIIRNQEEPIIRKKFASAFFGTDLLTRLITKQIDTLILTGCTTSGCIRATTVDAIQYGFRPIVVEDAVCDRSDKAHQQSLTDIEAKYADLLLANELLSFFMEK